LAAKVKMREGAAVIDGGGRTLTPGLIDRHVHLQIVESIDDLLVRPYYET
jgi:imidazolonepropionase-like amidohydrolase